jgi:hypothetical protein
MVQSNENPRNCAARQKGCHVIQSTMTDVMVESSAAFLKNMFAPTLTLDLSRKVVTCCTGRCVTLQL